MTDQPADAAAGRPETADRAVDETLAAFDAALLEDPASGVEAATEAHRRLQARLSTPAPPSAAAPPPGQARPGPRR